MIRRVSVIILAAGYLAIFLSGCTPKKSDTHRKENTESGVVDYITGAEDIKAYKREKAKIEEINKTLKKRSQLK